MAVYTMQGHLRRHASFAGRVPLAVSPFVDESVSWRCSRTPGGGTWGAGAGGGPGRRTRMGKTRLLMEFCRRMPAYQVTVYEGRCLSYGQSTPYLPVRDLVRQVCGLAEGATRV